MKKIIISLLIAVVLPLSASAYYPYGGYGFGDVQVDVTARGGYNFTEKTPLVGGVLGLNYWGFRGEIELGWSCFNAAGSTGKENFCYISPMVGYVYGFNHQLYAMAGITNWGHSELGYNQDKPEFKSNALFGKVKVGCNLFLMPRLFLNIDLSYILPRHFDRHNITYDGLALRAGVGFKF